MSREFTKLRTGETTPVAGWLRSLARDLHEELGGPGVGALGMCFTGGFALAMMVDASVIAPVVCQPSTPFVARRQALRRPQPLPRRPRHRQGQVCRRSTGAGAALPQGPADGHALRHPHPRARDAFIRVEFEGAGHSTVTEHRQQAGVDAVLGFFADNLR